VTADPELQAAISAVSSVRKKSLGGVTAMTRKHTEVDEAKAKKHRVKTRKAQLEEKTRLAALRAQKVDVANSTALVTTVAELDVKLTAKSGKGTKVEMLRRQVAARLEGGRAFQYPPSAVGMAFRSAKLKSRQILTSPPSGQDDVEYRTDLVKLMIVYDIQEGRYSAANLAAVVQPTELTGSLVPGSLNCFFFL
jgi:hypothetical protein